MTVSRCILFCWDGSRPAIGKRLCCVRTASGRMLGDMARLCGEYGLGLLAGAGDRSMFFAKRTPVPLRIGPA